MYKCLPQTIRCWLLTPLFSLLNDIPSMWMPIKALLSVLASQIKFSKKNLKSYEALKLQKISAAPFFGSQSLRPPTVVLSRLHTCSKSLLQVSQKMIIQKCQEDARLPACNDMDAVAKRKLCGPSKTRSAPTRSNHHEPTSHEPTSHEARDVCYFCLTTAWIAHKHGPE